MNKIGFTNRLAVLLVVILICGICMSFYLAVYSIKAQYLGTLACWTVCFTPIGVSLDIVLNSVVKKSQAENTGADGEGIRYKQISSMIENGGPTI